LRHHLSFVANNLGVTLEDLNKTEEAFQVFSQAKAISPSNISALLNLFELISRGLHPEKKDAIALELRRKVENVNERYPLWALSRHYGYVRNYELFVRMGWTWAMSSCPGSVLAGLRSSYAVQIDDDRRAALTTMMASLYEMRGDFTKSAQEYQKTLENDPKNTFAISGLVRLALQQSVGEAQKILRAGEAAGVTPRLLRQDWAAVYLVSGDLPQARVLLQDMGDEANASPMTLAMLAMVMLEQNEVASVETAVLPRLVKAAEGKDAYFVQVVQGRIWQSKGKEGHRNARLCYQRAAALRPDVQALTDVILMLDVSLGDQKAAEAHALSVLRQRPDHPYANFVIGSIRLEQGQYGNAETHLARCAAAAEPTLAALNNYAQVLCRIRKLEEAESVARRAVARASDRYEAWSTLAFVLASRDRLDEASEAQAKARVLNASDARLLLVDGLIAVRRGNREAAEKALAAVAGAKGLSMADQRELASLREALSRLGQPAP
jgi:tetratricopeptide (TPR) repeat protein